MYNKHLHSLLCHTGTSPQGNAPQILGPQHAVSKHRSLSLKHERLHAHSPGQRQLWNRTSSRTKRAAEDKVGRGRHSGQWKSSQVEDTVGSGRQSGQSKSSAAEDKVGSGGQSGQRKSNEGGRCPHSPGRHQLSNRTSSRTKWAAEEYCRRSLCVCRSRFRESRWERSVSWKRLWWMSLSHR